MGELNALPRAVIVDVDGTLAFRDDTAPGVRRFYDWHRVGEDAPNPPVVELVQLLAETSRYRIIVMSGRDEVCRAETAEWMAEHKISYELLLMRAAGDNRRDAEVKRELYEQRIAGRYEVVWVVDDRDQVVRMWREELGLTCLQVAYGDF